MSSFLSLPLLTCAFDYLLQVNLGVNFFLKIFLLLIRFSQWTRMSFFGDIQSCFSLKPTIFLWSVHFPPECFKLLSKMIHSVSTKMVQSAGKYFVWKNQQMTFLLWRLKRNLLPRVCYRSSHFRFSSVSQVRLYYFMIS